MINAMKKANLMILHQGNNVLDKFQPPVKLHWQDPEATSPLDVGILVKMKLLLLLHQLKSNI